jgi:hypothetical protein
MQVKDGAPVKAHIDDQAHAQVSQEIIFLPARGIPNKEVVGNLGKIHGRNLITNKTDGLHMRRFYRF